MRTLISTVIAIVAIVGLLFQNPALAGDTAAGEKIFSANCAACHAGGKNAVNPAKTLQKADLSKYEKDSIEAIVAQVTKGKGAMPAFGGRLQPAQIEDVATYVLGKANSGW